MAENHCVWRCDTYMTGCVFPFLYESRKGPR